MLKFQLDSTYCLWTIATWNKITKKVTRGRWVKLWLRTSRSALFCSYLLNIDVDLWFPPPPFPSLQTPLSLAIDSYSINMYKHKELLLSQYKTGSNCWSHITHITIHVFTMNVEEKKSIQWWLVTLEIWYLAKINCIFFRAIFIWIIRKVKFLKLE